MWNIKDENITVTTNAIFDSVNSVLGYFCIFQKKNNPDIVLHKTVRNLEHVKEYVNKVNFYLPEMKKLLYDKVPAEYYPRRPLYAFNSPCGLCDYFSLCIKGSFEGYTIGYDATEKTYNKPYVSPTEIIRYETCPRQWAFHKSGITTPIRTAIAECGTCMHIGIYRYIMDGEDPVEVFMHEWSKKGNENLIYNKKDTHGSLAAIAQANLAKFPEKWESWKLKVLLVENSLVTDVGNFYSKVKPDLIAKDNEDNVIIVDWKFTSVSYEDSWIGMSDQITAAAVAFLYN